MTLNIQRTPEDFIEAALMSHKAGKTLKQSLVLLLVITAMVVLISLIVGRLREDLLICWLVAIAAVAFFAWFFNFFYPRRLRRIFFQQKSAQLPYVATITDETLQTKSEVSEEKLPWNHFIQWRENDNLFVLYQSDTMIRIMPKRCFASPQQIIEFHHLLEKKLGPARA